MKTGDLVVPRKSMHWSFVGEEEAYILLDPNEDPSRDEPSLPIKWSAGIIGTIIEVYSDGALKVMIPDGIGYCFPSEVKLLK